MARTPDLLAQDLQASAPEVRLSLTRAGVANVSKAIRVRHEGRETVMAAEIQCTVDLDRTQKGVHMSRFPELFEEAIEAVVGSEALHVEMLAEQIARQIVERQGALRAEARITARWPVRRKTPVSGLATQEMVSLVGIAAATTDGRPARRGGRGERDQRVSLRAGPRPRSRRRTAGRGRLRGRRRRADPRPSSPSPPTTSAGEERSTWAPIASSTQTTWSRSSKAR